MIVFCDIDGTLVDNEHRRALVESRDRDQQKWDLFYSDDELRRDIPYALAQLNL
jgi:FMN phosphatase YigB (HAD superfamily)